MTSTRLTANLIFYKNIIKFHTDLFLLCKVEKTVVKKQLHKFKFDNYPKLLEKYTSFENSV